MLTRLWVLLRTVGRPGPQGLGWDGLRLGDAGCPLTAAPYAVVGCSFVPPATRRSGCSEP